MKVYVIDPDKRSIEEVNFEWDYMDYPALNAKVNELGKFADGWDSVMINTQEDRILVDDTGLYKPLTRWWWAGYPDPLCGIGVVCGYEGERSVSVKCSMAFLEKYVMFQ